MESAWADNHRWVALDTRARLKTLFILFAASTVLTVAAAAIGWWLQGWVGLVAGLVIAGVLGDVPIAISLNRQRRLIGGEALVGREARVERPFVDGVGQVRLDGTLWKARLAGQAAPAPGGSVRVEGVDGVTLRVTGAAGRADQ